MAERNGKQDKKEVKVGSTLKSSELSKMNSTRTSAKN